MRLSSRSVVTERRQTYPLEAMTAAREPVSIPRLAVSLPAPYETRDLVTANDSVLRVVRVEGKMDWHRHEEDQLFICWQGSFSIEIEGSEPVVLGPGDVFVIPRGTRHKTFSDSLSYALMSIGVHNLAPA